MPELGINLISQGELNKDTYSILTYNQIILKNKNKIITRGSKIRNLYYLPINIIKDQVLNTTTNNTNTSISINNNNIHLWHQRLGHINYTYLNKLETSTIGYKNNNTNTPNNHLYNINNCEICLKAKFTNKINHKTNTTTTKLEYLDKIASDICGPINPITYNRYKYFITFLDKATRYLEVQLIRTKDEAYNCFSDFKSREENNKDNKRIRIYSTDNGTKFINKRFKALFNNSGIIHHQLSPAYTPEPNGFIERINRTIINKARSLLYNSNLPLYLWGEAIIASTYLYNRTPHSGINYKTPFELKYNNKPDISNISVWGSITYYKNKGNNIKKLDSRANKGYLIGYGQNQYRIWDATLNKAIWSRNIKILENHFMTSNNTNITSTSNNEVEIDFNTSNIKNTSNLD